MKEPVFEGLWLGKTQTGLLGYRDQLESWNYGYTNCTSQLAMNNKGADQTAQMFWVWFDFCFTALQHILGRFERGQLP